MKAFAEKFYKSKAWLRCRNAYISSVYGLCERCGRPGKIVHHKNYLNEQNINDPEVSLNFDNLEYLCQDCHNAEHQSLKDCDLIRGGLFMDSNGHLIRAPGQEDF